MMAQFPAPKIAELSYRYRTLGLGFANIGGLLMADGVPYDSDEGRAICAAITAVMTGISYATSAEMAKELGPFPGYEPNKGDMLRVIRNHRRAVQGHKTAMRPDRRPGAADRRRLQGRRPDRGRQARLGFGARSRTAHGFRNAQATVVAPTGTIGLVMDCDTTASSPISRW